MMIQDTTTREHKFNRQEGIHLIYANMESNKMDLHWLSGMWLNKALISSSIQK